jgi:hypothetical protein
MSTSVPSLPFSEFVDTTDSEQRWQIYNATGGFAIPIYDSVVVTSSDGNGNPLGITYSYKGATVATLVLTWSGTNFVSCIRTS